MTGRYGRFAEVFEFDRQHLGLPEQHAGVIDALTPIFGTDHHKLLQRLDRQVNRGVAADGTVYHGRSFLSVAFHPFMTSPGTASPSGFSLSAAMGYAGCHEVSRHELGHCVDDWLLTDADREWFRLLMFRDTWAGAYESFAEAFREWLGGGSWQQLTPILLPENLS